MSKKLTTSEFQNRLNNIYGDQFIVLEEYINNETKIKIHCNKCGKDIMKAPVKMTGSEKSGCYICNKKNNYKDKKFLQNELDEKYPNEFYVIEEYVNARTPILMRRKCGHYHRISPDNALRGKGCLHCGIKQSKYMDFVENYFLKNNITYIKEKRFDLCKNIRTLPFDYYLPKYNECIEVDGEFHFDRNSVYINNRSKYEEVHKRDLIKNEFCKKENIRLLRLPYFEFENFEKILDKELHVNTEITDLIS